MKTRDGHAGTAQSAGVAGDGHGVGGAAGRVANTAHARSSSARPVSEDPLLKLCDGREPRRDHMHLGQERPGSLSSMRRGPTGGMVGGQQPQPQQHQKQQLATVKTKRRGESAWRPVCEACSQRWRESVCASVRAAACHHCRQPLYYSSSYCNCGHRKGCAPQMRQASRTLIIPTAMAHCSTAPPARRHMKRRAAVKTTTAPRPSFVSTSASSAIKGKTGVDICLVHASFIPQPVSSPLGPET